MFWVFRLNDDETILPTKKRQKKNCWGLRMPKASLGAFPKLHGPLVIRAGTFQYSIHVRSGEERLLMTFNNGGGSPLNFIGTIPRSATKQTATKIRNQTKKTSQHPFDPKNQKIKLKKNILQQKCTSFSEQISAHPRQNSFVNFWCLICHQKHPPEKKKLRPPTWLRREAGRSNFELGIQARLLKKDRFFLGGLGGGFFSQISNSPVKRLQKVPQLDLWMLVSL